MSGFEIYPDAIMRVLNERDAVDTLTGLAEKVVDDARNTGPRNARHQHHEIDDLAVGEAHLTADGAIVDIDWASSVWHLIEFGSVNNPPYRPVTSAAQNAGLQVLDRRAR